MTPEEKSLRRRLVAFAVVVLLVLLAFIIRLAWLQLVRGGDYYRQATAPASGSTSAAPAESARPAPTVFRDSPQKAVVWPPLF